MAFSRVASSVLVGAAMVLSSIPLCTCSPVLTNLGLVAHPVPTTNLTGINATASGTHVLVAEVTPIENILQTKDLSDDHLDTVSSAIVSGVSHSQANNVSGNIFQRISTPTDLSAGHENDIEPRSITKENKSIAKRREEAGIQITLINATPYRWKLDHERLDEMEYLHREDFSEYIEPGEACAVYAYAKSGSNWGEVQYNIMGTSQPMSFTLTAGRYALWEARIQYGGALKTVGHDELDFVMDYEIRKNRRIVNFVLSGQEGRFYANDAPYNWMNSMLDDISNFTMRDISLPRSHHAGMWKHKGKKWGDYVEGEMTETQYLDVYDQLAKGGVRVLDLRPALFRDGRIREHHGSWVLNRFHGWTGATLEDMIKQINRFNDQYPGELIIIDVDPKEMRSADDDAHDLDGKGVEKVIKALKTLKYRAVFSDEVDITQLPISHFIGDGETAVIIRMGAGRVRDIDFPGGSEGFVTDAYFPVNKRWSNTNDLGELRRDQSIGMWRGRKHGNQDILYAIDWIITGQLEEIVEKDSIVEYNQAALIALSDIYWPSLKGWYYAQWVALDGITGPELKGIAIAVNQCFLAKRCGSLNNRVVDAPSPIPVRPSTTTTSLPEPSSTANTMSVTSMAAPTTATASVQSTTTKAPSATTFKPPAATTVKSPVATTVKSPAATTAKPPTATSLVTSTRRPATTSSKAGAAPAQ